MLFLDFVIEDIVNKTVKKLDNNVIKALTIACETAKQKVVGFEWLTHTASYDRFPGSLIVTCVFDSKNSYAEAVSNELDVFLRKLIQSQLLKIGVVLKNPKQHVFFDNEEDCLDQHNGDWERRLNPFSPT
jgi:hypothetical protein